MATSTNIEFFFETETISYNPRKISEWLTAVLKQHSKKAGDIKIIFCDDDNLLQMNKQYLNHVKHLQQIFFNL